MYANGKEFSIRWERTCYATPAARLPRIEGGTPSIPDAAATNIGHIYFEQGRLDEAI